MLRSRIVLRGRLLHRGGLTNVQSTNSADCADNYFCCDHLSGITAGFVTAYDCRGKHAAAVVPHIFDDTKSYSDSGTRFSDLQDTDETVFWS